MPRYEILPHPADGKFRAYGRTLAEAFGNAALATASLMWDWTTVPPRLAVPVRVSGQDREQLLVKFLNELLYLFETRDFVLAAAEVVRVEPRDGAWTLEAVLRGDDRTAGHEVHGIVKAATYNEMEITENGGFTLQVVVDM
jgi:SHS2 domain-containing protein